MSTRRAKKSEGTCAGTWHSDAAARRVRLGLGLPTRSQCGSEDAPAAVTVRGAFVIGSAAGPLPVYHLEYSSVLVVARFK